MKEKEYKVYLIINKINGKMYVGITSTSIKRRFSGHNGKASKCYGIKNALNKYGKENFLIVPILSNLTHEQASLREEYYIKLYNTMSPRGYNLICGKKDSYILSKETRYKMSNKKIGKIKTKEEIEKRKQTMRNTYDLKKIAIINRDIMWRNMLNKDRGAVYNKKNRNWMSKIMVYGKQFFLGSFNTKEEAVNQTKRCITLLTT